MLNPVPVVMVSCGNTPDEYNIMTVAWCGTVCSDPAMCYISVRPERHSYPIIQKNQEFVINLVSTELTERTDWCGVRSGKKYNKFLETDLTHIRGSEVTAPI
ncbi:MAG: flavin reductase family protein, partial [Bacteroidales bacterium]|nr:flavin reductase family protein [Bacteroidales bacterium]